MKRSGVIAQKLGMSTILKDSGESVPVTLFALGDCCVVSKEEKNGQNILQIGSGKLKHPNKPQTGFFEKAGVSPKKVIKSFKVDADQVLEVGTVLGADFFEEGSYVDITGVTIGRGFAGAMKRHNFSGLRATHGVSVSHRSHGSTGHRKDPGKVFKGKKMAGHMGCVQVTVQNLKIMQVDKEQGVLVIKGSVPGFEKSWLKICDAIKKSNPKKTASSQK